LAGGNLLLERRRLPRFRALKLIETKVRPLSGGLVFPGSSAGVLWSMECPLSFSGSLQNTFFRVPEVTMSIDGDDAYPWKARVIVPLLASPVLGTYLPTTLDDFAELFKGGIASYSNDRIDFGGPGMEAYGGACRVSFWRTDN
jgi:hypothetical protein